MADDDPDRQRLEDMLKASEQRRPAGGSPGEGASTQGGDEPREERPDDGGGAGGNGERPARATGTAKTMATAGLITGGLSIPGALFPIVGAILGIAAIVLGVLVSRRAADARAKIAIGLGAVGLVLSVALFAIGLATLEEDGDSGDDSEESDDEDSGDDEDDGDSGDDSDSDEDDSSSLLPPYVVAVTYRGVAV